jgi:hypothetical protein
MFDQKFPKQKIYLTRRNLLTLLSKLDRQAAGDATMCSIIKYKQDTPEYQQTMDSIMVIAVDDNDYYESQNRLGGEVHPSEEAFIQQQKHYELFSTNIRQHSSGNLFDASIEYHKQSITVA